jgi:hypothetical protein
MSVSILALVDRVDWLRVRQEVHKNFTSGTVSLVHYIAWRQASDYPFTAFLAQRKWLALTGMSKTTFYRSLEPAVESGLVERVVRGSDVNKTTAHYRVVEESLHALLELLVPSTGQVTPAEEPEEWDTIVPLEELPSPKYGTNLPQVRDPKQQEQHITKRKTYPRIDRLRKLLEPSFRDYLDDGPNLDELLKLAEKSDPNFIELARHLNGQNYATAYNIGGLVLTLIQEYLGVRNGGERNGWPKWCGDDHCDRDTRRWSEPSYDERGRPYYECPKCHPERVGSRSSTSGDFDFDNTFRKPE